MDPPQDAAQRGGEGAGEGGRLIGGGFGTERLRNPPARAERERLGSGRQPWSPASWRGGRSQPRIQVFVGGLREGAAASGRAGGCKKGGTGCWCPPAAMAVCSERTLPGTGGGWSQHPCCSAWWGAQKGWGHPQGTCQLPPGAPHPFGSGTQRPGAGTEHITPNPSPTSIPFGDPTPAPQKQVPPPFLVHGLRAGCWLPAVAVLAARADGQTLKGTFGETVGAKGFWDV